MLIHHYMSEDFDKTININSKERSQQNDYHFKFTLAISTQVLSAIKTIIQNSKYDEVHNCQIR